MPDPYDWAIRLETEAKQMMIAGEYYKPLIDYEKLEQRQFFPSRRPIITFACSM
jgi:hypothetical protein